MTFSTGGSDYSQAYSAPNLLIGGSTGQLTETAASGNVELTQDQTAVVLGSPIPIVFCRRVGSSGGVLISPPAAESRFEQAATLTTLTLGTAPGQTYSYSVYMVTVYYRLVLSEGKLPAVQVRDVYQVRCRIGTLEQAYNGPAGDWVAGNVIPYAESKGLFPGYCGGGGSYQGITSLSFKSEYEPADSRYKNQIHVFIRNGVEVKRLVDGVTGSSNNFADLMALAMSSSSRVPARLLDTTNLLAAAKFLDVNGLRFDAIISESHNLEDYISNLAPLFLLRTTRRNGRYGLKPLLPTTSTGAINTGTIDWSWTFTENELLDRFEINWIPRADRQPFCSVMSWRQQPEDDIGMIRTFEYRSNELAEFGPYQSTDLSAFCTTEDHAVKVAAFQQAVPAYVTHTLGIALKPGPWSGVVSQGDIVRVTVPRRMEKDGTTWHDYLYEVGQVNYGNDGEISLDLIHFPVNSTGKSIIALIVSRAVGNGVLLSSGRTGLSCDINSGSSLVPVEITEGPGTGDHEDEDIEDQENKEEEADPGGTDENPTDIKDGGGSGDPVNVDDPVDDPESSTQEKIIDSTTGEIIRITDPFPRVVDGQGNLKYPTGIRVTRSAWSSYAPYTTASAEAQTQVFTVAAGMALIGAKYDKAKAFVENAPGGYWGQVTCGFTLAGWTQTGEYVYNAYPIFSPATVNSGIPDLYNYNSSTVGWFVEPVITYELIY